MEIQEFIHCAEGLRGDLLQQARHLLDNDEDAEDVVQETLVKLWIARNRIEDCSKMRNMASVICRNVSLNMLRDANTSVPIENAENISIQVDPLSQLEERETLRKLKQSILNLTDKQRAILKMRNVDNMSYSDIAKVLGTTESSVRGMISKARMELLKQMKGATLCAVLIIGFSVLVMTIQDQTKENPIAEVSTPMETNPDGDTQQATISTSELLETIDMLAGIGPEDATITVSWQDEGFIVNTVSSDGQKNSYMLRRSSDDSTIELISKLIEF